MQDWSGTSKERKVLPKKIVFFYAKLAIWVITISSQLIAFWLARLRFLANQSGRSSSFLITLALLNTFSLNFGTTSITSALNPNLGPPSFLEMHVTPKVIFKQAHPLWYGTFLRQTFQAKILDEYCDGLEAYWSCMWLLLWVTGPHSKSWLI